MVLYSFTLDNIQALLEKTGFSRIDFHFELRGARRWHLRQIQKIVQVLPTSLIFPLMMAYWVIARRRVGHGTADA
jgi:hypothetical protein